MTATIFWLKTRAQWTETMVQEHIGNTGPIVKIERVIVAPPLRGAAAPTKALSASMEPRVIEQLREQ